MGDRTVDRHDEVEIDHQRRSFGKHTAWAAADVIPDQSIA
jgi:hypothetical protein